MAETFAELASKISSQIIGISLILTGIMLAWTGLTIIALPDTFSKQKKVILIIFAGLGLVLLSAKIAEQVANFFIGV